MAYTSSLENFFFSKRGLAVFVGMILAATGIASALTLSDPERGPADQNWQRIQDDNLIRIGIDPSIPPFGNFAEDGIVGLDVDIGHALADGIGVEAQIVPIGFDGLYDSLLVGEADIVIAALRADPLRLDRVRYTDSYFDAGHILVSREGYQTLDALDGKRVGVEFASEGDLVARQDEAITLERFLTAEDALLAVNDGEIDAAFVDRISAILYTPDELIIADTVLVPDPYVISVRRSDWRLYDRIQTILESLQNDGTLDRIIAKWLGEFSP